MATTKTTTVSVTEFTAEDIEALLDIKYGGVGKKGNGWETEYVWETGRNSRQPRLKMIRRKVTT